MRLSLRPDALSGPAPIVGPSPRPATDRRCGFTASGRWGMRISRAGPTAMRFFRTAARDYGEIRAREASRSASTAIGGITRPIGAVASTGHGTRWRERARTHASNISSNLSKEDNVALLIDPVTVAGLVTREVRTGERRGTPTRIAVARRTYGTGPDDLWN